ncbi:hypothetical protein [Massiliimalia timonensis]|uniref:hypothetical protein n=1 Tax=Massiliimalia timonensis TaxID=1987501 RepID=UPI00189CF832|nr:hypothetical protein [Massiliimalia timonensis]
MSSAMIKHPLRVFISSKCGGKYSIARKALETLLKSTGLVEVYVFENEPASSEDTQSAYLEYVDQSNLCIFLVDNQDGAPPAVLSEEKRAKDKSLRLLYIFCDEFEKRPTPMQESIKNSLSQKYQVVHEFSDIVSTAYDSVMQDLIAVYKRKEKPFLETESNVAESVDGISQLNVKLDTLHFSKSIESEEVYKTLTANLIPRKPNDNQKETTILEKLLSEQLKVVLSQKAFDTTIIDEISNEITREKNNTVTDLLKLRFAAQKSYFSAQYEECMKSLQEAIKLAIDSEMIPAWISNDIAIDIRHVQGKIDEQNSCITIDNPGQKYLNESDEPVYFPYLDRHVENMWEEIAKKFYSQASISPYTTSIGGLDRLFRPLSEAFCIAEKVGSIVQTVITKDRLISIYLMLCTIYSDHDLLVELIRLLVINQDNKQIDTIIRTYNQSMDILNESDMRIIINSLDTFTDTTRKMMSKYLLVGKFGNYFDDSSFNALQNELVDFAMQWSRDDKRIFNYSSYIFDFFISNTLRIDIVQIVDFVCSIFDNRLARFYMDSFKIIRNIDFSTAAIEEQKKVMQIFTGIATGKVECHDDQYFSSALIRFCKTTTLNIEGLDTEIAKKYPDFYKNTFRLEMASRQKVNFIEFVENYLNEAKSRNELQGQGGKYSGYTYECYDVIFNILTIDPVRLNKDLLNNIVDTIIETLSKSTQTVKAKMSAIKLLQYIFYEYQAEYTWNYIQTQMIEHANDFSSGYEMFLFEKDTNFILSFQYDLLLSAFDPSRNDILLERMLSLDLSDAYALIRILNIVATYLRSLKAPSNTELLLTFLYFSISHSQHKEKDVKYYATLCLIELSTFDLTKRLALIHLLQLMDTGSHTTKIAIISRIKMINDPDDAYITQIVNKGKADNNYLVRYVTARENHVDI